MVSEPGSVTVIFATPSVTPVTTPSLFTVATASLSDSKVTVPALLIYVIAVVAPTSMLGVSSEVSSNSDASRESALSP